MAQIILKENAAIDAVKTKKQATVQTSRGEITAQPGEYILTFINEEKTVISEKAYKKLFKAAEAPKKK